MNSETRTLLMVFRKVLRELLGALEDYLHARGVDVSRSIKKRNRYIRKD